MQRWITAILGTLMVAFGAAAPATAQLIGGGLTAQPTVRLGSDILTNGGFETLSGETPARWRVTRSRPRCAMPSTTLRVRA